MNQALLRIQLSVDFREGIIDETEFEITGEHSENDRSQSRFNDK